MKKVFAIFVLAVMLLAFVEIARKPSVEQIVDDFDRIVHIVSLSQITRNNKLIGKRDFIEKDSYVGNYSSSCVSEKGRDVIFGGASVKDKKVVVKAKILTENGSATLRIRLGSEVREYKIDNKTPFEQTINLQGGGNYIMIDYDNFTGTVDMTSNYAK